MPREKKKKTYMGNWVFVFLITIFKGGILWGLLIRMSWDFIIIISCSVSETPGEVILIDQEEETIEV